MKTKIASVPRVVEGSNGDWYVYFSVKNPLTDKMVPRKVYEGFKQCETTAQKRVWGKKLVAELIKKLKAGWNPLDDSEKFIYKDETDYELLSRKFNATKKTVKNTRFYISEYLQSRKNGLKPKTYSTYQSKLRIYIQWLEHAKFGEYDLTEIDNKIILRYFDFLIIESKLDRVTILRYEQILKDYYNYLVKKGKINVNPVFDVVRPPKSKDMAARPINDRDLKLLLSIIQDRNPQLYLACMFQYYLAIRPGQELRFLKVKDIDVHSYKVVVDDVNSKINRRTVDMPVDLAELCIKYQINLFKPDFYVFGRNGVPGIEPLGQNTLRERFNKFRDELKLPKIYKFYSMKHTGGGKLLEAGLTLEEVKNHFGHKSIETTDHYVKRHFGNRNSRIIHGFPKPH
ncbi:MAG: integrase [Bacteroidetes bacterium]|nr:MAG: integrase [Bacteroidota bacterium]